MKTVMITYEMAQDAGIVADAKKGGVTIKPTDVIFAVDGVRAVACVRMIRRKLARLCGCWVAKEHRGQGIGELLVRERIKYIIEHTGARAIDTFAFNKALYLRLGFEERAGFKIGTTLLRLVIKRG